MPPSAPAEWTRNSQSDPWKAFFLLMPAFGLNYGNVIRNCGNRSKAAEHWGELPGKGARMSWSCTQGDVWTGATIPACRQKWDVSVFPKSCSDLPFCDFYPHDALLQYWCFVIACSYYNIPLSAAPLLITPAVQVAGLTRALYFWPGILWSTITSQHKSKVLLGWPCPPPLQPVLGLTTCLTWHCKPDSWAWLRPGDWSSWKLTSWEQGKRRNHISITCSAISYPSSSLPWIE